MTGFLTALVAMTIAAAPAASPQAPKLGKIVTYKNWGVGCDNGLDCQAVTYMPDNFPGEGLMLSFNRAAGRNGEVKMAIWSFATKSPRYRLIVNGKAVHSGTISTGADSVEIAGADAIKIARALASGASLRLVDGSNVELGKISLAGSSAALRHIDAIQGRAGSNGAIVARGSKASSAKMVNLPIIAAPKITPNSVLPDTTALVKLSASSPCAEVQSVSNEDVAYSLGVSNGLSRSLVMLNCGSGAYNFSTAPYIGTRDAKGVWSFAPAKFDYDNDWGITDGDALQLLVNSDWDPASQVISSFSKGRGVGDCGSSEQYAWDGEMFRLILASRMDECRGSLDWITVWRAEVKLTG